MQGHMIIPKIEAKMNIKTMQTLEKMRINIPLPKEIYRLWGITR